MPVIPDRISEQIDFSRLYAQQWSSDPSGIGLTPQRVAAVGAAADLAHARFAEAAQARLAAKAATMALHSALRDMHELTSEAVQQIRLFAETTNDPDVFALAHFAPPARPGPTPAPGQPNQLGAVLNNDGTLTIRWKPVGDTTGVFFTIRRKLPGERTFSIIGTAGTNRSGQRGFKSFIDHDLPAGLYEVEYTVQAQRGGAGHKSPVSQVLTVSLGNPPPRRADAASPREPRGRSNRGSARTPARSAILPAACPREEPSPAAASRSRSSARAVAR